VFAAPSTDYCLQRKCRKRTCACERTPVGLTPWPEEQGSSHHSGGNSHSEKLSNNSHKEPSQNASCCEVADPESSRNAFCRKVANLEFSQNTSCREVACQELSQNASCREVASQVSSLNTFGRKVANPDSSLNTFGRKVANPDFSLNTSCHEVAYQEPSLNTSCQEVAYQESSLNTSCQEVACQESSLNTFGCKVANPCCSVASSMTCSLMPLSNKTWNVMPTDVFSFCSCCERGLFGIFRALLYVQGDGEIFFRRTGSDKNSVQNSMSTQDRTEIWPWPQAKPPDGRIHRGTASPPSTFC
jgi:hypothetical protein